MTNEATFFSKFKRHKSGMLGLSLIILLCVMALGADLFSPWNPIEQSLGDKLLPPFWLENGGWSHLFGTDILGRDVFARLLHGARISLVIGTFAVLVGALIGIPLGAIAGYWEGILGQVIMGGTNILMAIPSLLLAVCAVAILGPSLENAILAIGLVAVPSYVRMAYARMLSEKQKDYISADISLGRSHPAILVKTALPNMISTLSVVATLSFGGAILDAAGLSFIGLGAQPPTPEWGALLTEGKSYIFQAPWLILFPGIGILLAVLGFNLLGDALSDILDPKSK